MDYLVKDSLSHDGRRYASGDAIALEADDPAVARLLDLGVIAEPAATNANDVNGAVQEDGRGTGEAAQEGAADPTGAEGSAPGGPKPKAKK